MSVQPSGSSDLLAHEVLALDTEIFGFSVARITATKIPTAEALKKTLEHLEKKGVKLVYYTTSSTDQENNAHAQTNKGLLADEKVHYVFDVRKCDAEDYCKFIQKSEQEFRVRRYPKTALPTEQLYNIAVQGGGTSRFYRDEHIPVKGFEKMYRRMMENYINRSLADEIFVITTKDQEYNPQGKILGLLVLGQGPDGEPIAPLLSVTKDRRAQKLGLLLSAHGIFYIKSCGYEFVHVYTQLQNTRARRLYESLGLEMVEVQNVYHFHLGGLQKDETPRPRL